MAAAITIETPLVPSSTATPPPTPIITTSATTSDIAATAAAIKQYQDTQQLHASLPSGFRGRLTGVLMAHHSPIHALPRGLIDIIVRYVYHTVLMIIGGVEHPSLTTLVWPPQSVAINSLLRVPPTVEQLNEHTYHHGDLTPAILAVASYHTSYHTLYGDYGSDDGWYWHMSQSATLEPDGKGGALANRTNTCHTHYVETCARDQFSYGNHPQHCNYPAGVERFLPASAAAKASSSSSLSLMDRPVLPPRMDATTWPSLPFPDADDHRGRRQPPRHVDAIQGAIYDVIHTVVSSSGSYDASVFNLYVTGGLPVIREAYNGPLRTIPNIPIHSLYTLPLPSSPPLTTQPYSVQMNWNQTTCYAMATATTRARSKPLKKGSLASKPRHHATSGVIHINGRDQWLISGGGHPSQIWASVATSEIYDPLQQQWSTTHGIPVMNQRRFASVSCTWNNQLYVLGDHPARRGEVFIPASQASSPPAPSLVAAAAATSSSKSQPSFKPSAGLAGTWYWLPAFPFEELHDRDQYYQPMVVAITEGIIMLNSSRCYMYRPATNEWQRWLPDLPVGLLHASVCAIIDDDWINTVPSLPSQPLPPAPYHHSNGHIVDGNRGIGSEKKEADGSATTTSTPTSAASAAASSPPSTSTAAEPQPRRTSGSRGSDVIIVCGGSMDTGTNYHVYAINTALPPAERHWMCLPSLPHSHCTGKIINVYA